MEISKDDVTLGLAVRTTCAAFVSVGEVLGTVLMAEVEAVAQEGNIMSSALVKIPSTYTV